jgi:uncharacterized protein
MIAVDTNILVYAHRADSEWFPQASHAVRQLAEGAQPWAIAWPCIHEFLSIVTNPRIYKPPTPLGKAIRQVEYWLESPALQLIGEAEGYWPILSKMLRAGKVQGGTIHDARIAALCVAHGIRELWTLDRDFGRFPIRTVNPLAER